MYRFLTIMYGIIFAGVIMVSAYGDSSLSSTKTISVNPSNVKTTIVAPTITFNLSSEVSKNGWNLIQYIQYALQNNVDVQASQYTYKASEYDKTDALTSFLPEVTIQYTPSLQKDNTDVPLTSTDESTLHTNSSFTVDMSEILFNSGTNILNYQKSGYQLRYNKLVMNDAKNKILQQIASNYWNVQVSIKKYRIQYQVTELIRTQFLNTRRDYLIGRDVLDNVLRFQNLLINEITQLKMYQLNVQKALYTLYQSAGITNTSPGIVEDSTNPDENKLKNLSPLSIETQSSYKLLQYSEQIVDNEIMLNKLGVLPTVTVGVKSTYGNELENGLVNALTPDYGWNYQLYLRLAYTFRWGKDLHALRKVEFSKYTSQLNVQLRKQLLQAYTDIHQFPLTVNTDLNQLTYAKQVKKISQDAYNIVYDDYKRGKSTYLDLTNAITSVLSGNIQLIITYQAIRNDLLQYHYYKGDLYAYIQGSH